MNLHVQISWQAQHFVNLHVQSSWQAQNFVNLHVQISWQAQHFVDLEVRFCGRHSTLYAEQSMWRWTWLAQLCSTTLVRGVSGGAGR